MKSANRKLIANRSIQYDQKLNNIEEIPLEIKSSRPQKHIDSALNPRQYSRISRPSRWASNYANREPVTTHINKLKMETIDTKRL
jgi:hypothetical protein